MDVSKINVGKTYTYTSRTVPASAGRRGKVLEIDQKATGYWIRLHDKQHDKVVTVRPSQVGVKP